MEKEGLEEEDIQGYFTRRMIDTTLKYGKKPFDWDELSLSYKGSDECPLAIDLWRCKAEIGRFLDRDDFIMVLWRTDDGAYLDYKQVEDDDFEPGHIGVTTLEKSYNMKTSYPDRKGNSRILGVQGNLWSEYVIFPMYATFMLFPRILAIVEAGWSEDERRDYSSFRSRLEMMPKVLSGPPGYGPCYRS